MLHKKANGPQNVNVNILGQMHFGLGRVSGDL